MPSLCGGAEATREWFRAFTAHSFLACRPLRPRGVRHRYPDIRCRHWPSPNDHRLGTPDTPAIRFTRAVDFVASLVHFRYSLPGCSPPCTDQTGTPSLRGLLLPAAGRASLSRRVLLIPRAEKRLAWDVTDATPTGDEIACISCGGPLPRRESRFFLKYFLFGHPKTRKRCSG